ncbi:MAG: sensor histidine kinase, partial [Oligoflexales bacterium]|nr:sensor histidine kinase [Oligoflexales bacterium]
MNGMSIPVCAIVRFTISVTGILFFAGTVVASPYNMTEQELKAAKNIVENGPDVRVEKWFEKISKKMSRVIVGPKDEKVRLEKYSEYLEDRENKYDISGFIQDSSETFKWISHGTDKIPAFGFSESAYWFRYHIENRNGLKTRFFLDVSCPFLDYLDFYVFSEDGSYRIVKSGDQYPYSRRIVDHHNFVLPVEIANDKSVLIFVRFQSIGPLLFPAALWDQDFFNSEQSRELTIFGIYYGMIAVMVLYNLFLFFSIRDRAYVIYVLYALSYMIFQASFNGFGFKHLWPESIFMANYGVWIFLSFVNFFLCLFTQIFLQTAIRQRLLDRVLSFVFYPWILAGFALSVMGIRLAQFVLITFQPLEGVLLILTGILSLARGYRPARFYILAFAPLLLGAAILALKQVGILPSNFFTDYAPQIGSGVEIVLLSFAVGDKISLEQMEARKNIEELNSSLERKVEEKTSELRSANFKLTEIDKYKTSFFQNVSHEIRTPLTLILNPVEDALSRYPSDRDIAIAFKNSKRLLRLINQLLDFEKYSMAGTRFELVPVDLTGLIISAGDYFREAASRRNVEFVLKINDDLLGDKGNIKIFINGQEDALEKIIFNYLSNALKYVKDGGKITLRLQLVEGSAVISVTDNGIGIRDEYMEMLFKPFVQADDSSSRLHDGTGLGLALSKELAEHMNGSVDVRSTFGKGSCFSATFPLLRVEKPVIDLVTVMSDRKFQEELSRAALSMAQVSEIRSFTDLLEVRTISGEYDVLALIADDTMLGRFGNEALREIYDKNRSMKIFIMRTSKEGSLYEEPGLAGMKVRIFSFDRQKSEIADEIMICLNEIKPAGNGTPEEKHKIRDWLLADADDPAVSERETMARNIETANQ